MGYDHSPVALLVLLGEVGGKKEAAAQMLMNLGVEKCSYALFMCMAVQDVGLKLENCKSLSEALWLYIQFRKSEQLVTENVPVNSVRVRDASILSKILYGEKKPERTFTKGFIQGICGTDDMRKFIRATLYELFSKVRNDDTKNTREAKTIANSKNMTGVSRLVTPLVFSEETKANIEEILKLLKLVQDFKFSDIKEPEKDDKPDPEPIKTETTLILPDDEDAEEKVNKLLAASEAAAEADRAAAAEAAAEAERLAEAERVAAEKKAAEAAAEAERLAEAERVAAEKKAAEAAVEKKAAAIAAADAAVSMAQQAKLRAEEANVRAEKAAQEASRHENEAVDSATQTAKISDERAQASTVAEEEALTAEKTAQEAYTTYSSTSYFQLTKMLENFNAWNAAKVKAQEAARKLLSALEKAAASGDCKNKAKKWSGIAKEAATLTLALKNATAEAAAEAVNAEAEALNAAAEAVNEAAEAVMAEEAASRAEEAARRAGEAASRAEEAARRAGEAASRAEEAARRAGEAARKAAEKADG